MCQELFDDKRVTTCLILVWTLVSLAVFCAIMIDDNSPFLNFWPSDRTVLFGVKLDKWGIWWCVAIYTFVITAVAAYASDSIVPWITNTVQDHKTQYIPYTKMTCLFIIQVFTCYAVIMSVIGLFVALSQVDFMLIRLLADLVVNHFRTFFFLRGKTLNLRRYKLHQQKPPANQDASSDEEFEDIISAPKTDEIQI